MPNYAEERAGSNSDTTELSNVLSSSHCHFSKRLYSLRKHIEFSSNRRRIINSPSPHYFTLASYIPHYLGLGLPAFTYYWDKSAERNSFLLAVIHVMQLKLKTSIINQQLHLHKFHIKHLKTIKITPTCFDLF